MVSSWAVNFRSSNARTMGHIGAPLTGEVLRPAQVRVGRLIRRERREQRSLPVKQHDGDGFIPAPFGGGEGEASLWVQADNALDGVQPSVEPVGNRLLGVVGSPFGDDQSVFVHPHACTIAGEHEGITSSGEAAWWSRVHCGCQHRARQPHRGQCRHRRGWERRVVRWWSSRYLRNIGNGWRRSADRLGARSLGSLPCHYPGMGCFDELLGQHADFAGAGKGAIAAVGVGHGAATDNAHAGGIGHRKRLAFCMRDARRQYRGMATMRPALTLLILAPGLDRRSCANRGGGRHVYSVLVRCLVVEMPCYVSHSWRKGGQEQFVSFVYGRPAVNFRLLVRCDQKQHSKR